MPVIMPWPSPSVPVALLCMLFGCFFLSAPCAQTTSISSSGLGTNVSTPPPGGGGVYDITGGTRAGSNLFHSFGDFSVGVGDTANFLNNTSLLTSNILNRVTGGNLSNIFGGIKTTGFESANLFLMNPNGVIFGPGASLNVGGSFHTTTAEFLQLQDGTKFNVKPGSEDAMLTSAPVVAFGFLSEAQDQAPIQLEGATLEVSSGKTLSLVGGDIEIVGGHLVAPGGVVNLASVGSAGEVGMDSSTSMISISANKFSALGDISLKAGIDNFDLFFGFVPNPSSIDVTSSTGAGGSVFIVGDVTTIDRSKISAESTGVGNSGIIQLNVGRLVMKNGAVINSSATGTGTGGNVEVFAINGVTLSGTGSLDFNGLETPTAISTNTVGTAGNGGRIFFKTPILTIAENAKIQASSTGNGGAGTIDLNIGTLIVSDGAAITSQTSGPANGGTITINSISGTGPANTVGITNGQISANTSGGGHGGTISISAKNITVGTLGQINASTSTSSTGDAGSIIITDANWINVQGAITTNTASTGDGGRISVQNTDTLIVNNGGRLSTDTSSAGNAGNIQIAANQTHIDTQGSVSSSTTGQGDAGSIQINNTGQLRIAGGGNIRTDTTNASGNGGNIDITAATLSVSGHSSGIFAQSNRDASTASAGHGHAGNITIQAQAVEIANQGQISTSTQTNGDAGNIQVAANRILLDHQGSIASSSNSIEPGDTGNAGNIDVTGTKITLNHASQIAALTRGSGLGGNIKVSSSTLELSGGSAITASSLSRNSNAGRSGGITVSAVELLRLRENSRISVSTQEANAGSINIQVRDVFHLINSDITTSVANGRGSGGDITIDPQFVVLEEGSNIIAKAEKGNGGNIFITAGFLFKSFSPLSIISASSEQGIDGTVVIRSPAVDITSGTLLLPDSFLDAASILPERCATRTAAGVSSFVVTGRNGIPPQPDHILPSRYSDLGAASSAPSSRRSEMSPSIARSLGRLDMDRFNSDQTECRPTI